MRSKQRCFCSIAFFPQPFPRDCLSGESCCWGKIFALAMAGPAPSPDSLDMEEEHLIDSLFGMDSDEVKLVSKWPVDREIHCKGIGFEKLARFCRTRLCLLRNHSVDGLLEFGKPSFLDWGDKLLDALGATEFSPNKANGKLPRCIVSCWAAIQVISSAPSYILFTSTRLVPHNHREPNAFQWAAYTPLD